MGATQMTDWVLLSFRWIILLRHPRISYWYWKSDRFGRLPDPANPRTANDKYFWRKIFDRNPEFTKISDKLGVRDWLKEKQIGIEGPPVLWSGIDPADIPDGLLASGVVVKANHGSGTNIVLRDAPPDRAAFNRRMRKYYRKPQGRKKLEWGYFGVTRKLFVEKLIPDIIVEFKIWTYDQRIERIQIIYERFSDEGVSADVWTPDGQGGWTRFAGAPEITKSAHRPWPKMTDDVLAMCRKIGRHFDHMRVDILASETKLWFGELTVYSNAGKILLFGDVPGELVNTSWDLRQSWFMRTPQTGWRKLYADRLRRAITADKT